MKLFVLYGILISCQFDEGKKIAIQATGAVSWRRHDIKYRKNEAFVDVIESVNLLFSAEGLLLQNNINRRPLAIRRVWPSNHESISLGHA